ncbi:hypothetical protein [Tessaracoccus sp. MC1756]|uniref:hypothetical protein n=1 Tax=Tessaracoccus sp. MC1756 TaxID=2760311 RepID=UPI0015FF4FE4|nr:hypothetical protein [Tessaracoccus sp. MC1756]MBB1509819.1 hypothetical protein [Tessaracoccus sp. MC1756]
MTDQEDHTGEPMAERRKQGSWSRWVVVSLVVALAIAGTGIFAFRDYLWGARADARAAVSALKDGDLTALGEQLAENRGEPNFAYFFASGVTPRDLGDGLATVAGPSKAHPFAVSTSAYAYELMLTDLAGTLALATHGTGDLALSEGWTTDFIVATTNPVALYGEHDGFFDSEGKLREKQDAANRSNLMLLLSRGFWSLEFLQSVTKAYYNFDRLERDRAWPGPAPSKDVVYAPSPDGVYLWDGVLALTAALTANPEASEWAFTRFVPGTTEVEGADLSIGNFTHFLMFEHRFPESEGQAVGTSATVTALSAAIDSLNSAVEMGGSSSPNDVISSDVGPMHDAAALQALARELTQRSECSWSPLDYGHCVIDAAEAVWRFVQRWGRVVLMVLATAARAKSPWLQVVGVAAGVSLAVWDAIDGDFAKAGLSLASAVPNGALTKMAKGAKPSPAVMRGVSRSLEVAEIILEIRDATEKNRGG